MLGEGTTSYVKPAATTSTQRMRKMRAKREGEMTEIDKQMHHKRQILWIQAL